MSWLTRLTLGACLLAAVAGGWAMWHAPANAPPRAGCHLEWSGGVQLWRCK